MEGDIIMSRRPYIIILLILLAAIAATVGYMYYREKPQVSRDKTQEMLGEYKADLQGMYNELNENYERLAAGQDTAGWQSFSSDWIPRLSGIRPADIDKRLPSDYDGRKNVLVSTQGALISLWTEYNKDFTGDETNMQRAEEMKSGIENVFDNLEI
jgi:hypothetical protein